MSYKLEHIYKDDGTELNTAAVPTSLAGADQRLYDGRYLWVTCTSGVAIYEFWGESSDNEPSFDELNALLYPRYDSGARKKLKLITFISITNSQIKRVTRHVSLSLRPDIVAATVDGAVDVSGTTCTLTTLSSELRVITEVSSNPLGTSLTPKWIAQIGTKIYISNGANFSSFFEFDAQTQRPVRMVSLPIRVDTTRQVANSNLIAADGRLWFVNTYFDDATPQKIYDYDPITNVATGMNSPTRPQIPRAYLADGNNGYVYVTNYNNVSITKVSTTTFATSIIRTNALPSRIWADSNRRIWVNSYAGMLTLVDWDDDGVHNDYSTDDTASNNDGSAKKAFGLTQDYSAGNYLWWVDGSKIVRHNLNDKTQIESTGENDWSWTGEYPSGTPDSILMTPPQVIDAAGSTKTLAPHLFVCFDSTLMAIRIEDHMVYRISKAEVNAQAAVVGGSLGYFGD